jgi:hypothetical protein
MSAIVILTRQPGARILAALGAAALVLVMGVIVSLGWQADAHAGGGGLDWYVSSLGGNTDCRLRHWRFRVYAVGLPVGGDAELVKRDQDPSPLCGSG